MIQLPLPTTANRLRIAKPLVHDFAYIAARMRQDEREHFCAMTGATDYSADAAARYAVTTSGDAFCLVDQNDLPVFAGGFDALRPGVFEAWAMGTPEAWEIHWMSITLHCSREIRRLFASGAHRVQVVTTAARKRAHVWYGRGLGMSFEGCLYGFMADGQDAYIYARVKGGQA